MEIMVTETTTTLARGYANLPIELAPASVHVIESLSLLTSERDVVAVVTVR